MSDVLIVLLLLICYIFTISVNSQFTIVSSPPVSSVNGKLVHIADIAFTPRTIAKAFNTPIEYSGDECADTGGICTGNLRVPWPYFTYQLCLNEILPSGQKQIQVTSYLANTLNLPTINNTGYNPGSSVGSNLGYDSSSSNRRRLLSTDEQQHYKDVALYKFFLGITENIATNRKLLQSGAPPSSAYAKSFSNCQFDSSFCNAQNTQTSQYNLENADAQANLDGLSRQSSTLSLQVGAMQLVQNYTGQLLGALNDGVEIAQINQQKAQQVSSALNANNQVQLSIEQTINTSALAENNAVNTLTTVLSSLGYQLLQQQAAILVNGAIEASRRTAISLAVNTIQETVSIFAVELTQNLQMAQVVSSICNDLNSNVQQILNDPTTANILTALAFQAAEEAQGQGLQVLVNDPGIKPVTFTDAQKYETVMTAAYFKTLPVTLLLPNGTTKSSWKIERMLYNIECDVQYFATTSGDQSTYTAVSKWFGPQGECDVNPSSDCYCRMHVFYQESRNPIVANFVVNAAQNVQIQQMPTSSITTLLPTIYQVNTPLYNGNGTTIFYSNATAPIFNITQANGTVTHLPGMYFPVFRERVLYTLAQVQAEFANKCLQNDLSPNQIPSPLLAPATFNIANLQTPPGTLNYYVSSVVFSQTVSQIPTSPPINYGALNYTAFFTSNPALYPTTSAVQLSLKPFCNAAVDNVVQYRSISQPTYGSILYDGQIRAYNAWLPRLASVSQWVKGQLFSPIDITQDEWAYRQINGVNNTMTRATRATFVALSPDGK